ncbi:MAG TPA: hypothetical protein VH987_06020 [Candidatus Limnocylindria bacterium]
MTRSAVPIAPIPLARSRLRLMVAPAVLATAGVVAVAGGAVLGGLAGIGMVAAGMVVVALSVVLALIVVSVRLDVEVSTLRLRWIGGERRYTLARGPVTRVPLSGPEAARLRPRFGALGWGLGRARLRDSEDVDVVRLARTANLILVPTDHGRVGVAPLSEQQLLGALAAAARIQQRLDEAAARARPFTEPAERAEEVEVVSRPVDAVEAIHAALAERRPLTGIERTLLEERLAAERAAALHAAEAERAAAADAARMRAFAPAEPAVAAPRVRRARSLPRPQRPGWLRRPRPSISTSISPQHLLQYGVAVVPVLAAAAVYVLAATQGRLSMSQEELRPVAVALLATGPAAAAAGLVARIWFPRLVGLVILSSLVSMVLVGRVLLG